MHTTSTNTNSTTPNKSMLTSAYFNFFRDLTKNNAKTWFDENRSRYEHDVKRPFHAMVSAWITSVQSIEPTLHATPSDVIYRINRDIRFSADKTPYKVQMAAHLNLRGKKAMGFPGVYLEVGTAGGAIAAGSYMPNKEELPALRDLVLHEGADLRAAITDPLFKKLYGELLGEESKILPAEFREAVVREPLVRKKQFYVWATIPKSVFTSDSCIKTLTEYYRVAKTMNDVLARAL